MSKMLKDAVKIGKSFYIIQTECDNEKIYFTLKRQRFNQIQALKEIIVPDTSKFSLEKLHKMFVSHFFTGLKKTKNVSKASEYVEKNLKKEFKNLISKEIEENSISNPILEKLCKNSESYCNEMLGFMLFKGKNYYECIKDPETSKEFKKTMHALHNFIETSKKAIANIAGNVKSVSFTINDKLIIYYREDKTVLIFICEYSKLGPQLKLAEKMKNKILEIIKD